MTVVLAGAPNAGKSSLLNALAQRAAAIVSAIPGTTRDVVSERIHLDGMPLHVLDTAGLRQASDEIESEGIRRARTHMERADRILIVIDDSDPHESSIDAYLPVGIPKTILRNKIDLSGRTPGVVNNPDTVELALSAKSGVGLDALRDHLKQCMGYRSTSAGLFSARRRHVDAIERTCKALDAGRRAMVNERAGELLAEELRRAQMALTEITGDFSADDLLGRIFSSFCIGK
jgi:tRNA modification GTPase